MTTIFPDQTFITVASIAIWNKNKIATGMAISLWAANATFYIYYCKLHLQCHMGYRALTSMWSGHSCRACKYFESIPLISIMHLLYPSHSFARVGHLSNKFVWWPTSQAPNLPSSRYPFLTSHYSSSCLLAYFACAVTVLA